MPIALTLPLAPKSKNVRIVAPAGALSASAKTALSGGQDVLKGRGYNISLAEHLFERNCYFAGTEQDRAQDLKSALTDPGVDYIWAARGGYGTAGAVASLSRHCIASNPKWLVGYSDLTVAHVRWQQAGLISLHGAMGATLAGASHASTDELFELLDAGKHARKHFAGRIAYDGDAWGPRCGVLWGGNLTVLASLCGATALPPVAGAPTILFLKDTEATFRAHRAAYQLAQSDALANVQAIVLGQWGVSSADETPADPDAQQERENALSMLRSIFLDRGLPVLSGIAVGHAPSARPLLLGAAATLDVVSQTLHVTVDAGQTQDAPASTIADTNY